MQCPACHQQNTAPSKFCAQCGSPLPAVPAPVQPRRGLKKLARYGLFALVVLVVLGIGVGGYAYVKAQKAREVALTYINHLATGNKQAACAMYVSADAASCDDLIASWQKQFAGAHSFAVRSNSWDGWTDFFTVGYRLEIGYTKGSDQGLIELTVFPDAERPAWTPIEAY